MKRQVTYGVCRSQAFISPYPRLPCHSCVWIVRTDFCSSRSYSFITVIFAPLSRSILLAHFLFGFVRFSTHCLAQCFPPSRSVFSSLFSTLTNFNNFIKFTFFSTSCHQRWRCIYLQAHKYNCAARSTFKHSKQQDTRKNREIMVGSFV